ncbi:MAG: MFS transporter [Caulobacterales bacterium]|nr:MFS transporter [Caulobacterales bacterium]
MTEARRAGSGRVPGAVLFGYALPGLPMAALMLPLYVFLPTYYAEDLGLGFTAVGAVLLIARLTDVASDPVIGLVSDRIDTRIGRRRPWILAGVPVVMAGVYALFLPGEGVGWGYLLAWTVIAYLGGAMITLPHSAWGAELSPDYHERSRIAGAREGVVIVGTLIAAAIPAVFGGDQKAALQVIGIGVCLVLPISVIAAVLLAPETPAPPRRPLAWRRSVGALVSNAPFARLIAAYLLNGVANGLPASLIVLFVTHVLETPSWIGLFLFVYLLSGVLSIPLWLRLSARRGKHQVWSGAMLAACAIFVCVPLLGAGDQLWFLAICLLTGAALGADLTLPASMQADVVDLDTLKSGRRRAGVYFALWGMATKLSLALAVGIAFPILGAMGFDPDTDSQAPRALFALAALYSLAPVAFKLAAIALMRGYPITADRQARVRRLIAARQAREEARERGDDRKAGDVADVGVDAYRVRDDESEGFRRA